MQKIQTHAQRRRFTLLALAATAALCGSPALSQPSGAAQKFPDVLSVKVRAAAGGLFDFDVTVSSPYDTAERYADAFRARSQDGKVVYGVRELLHDHANEQPFTRDLYRVNVPAGVKSVVIEARDRKFGYGGRVVELALPGR